MYTTTYIYNLCKIFKTKNLYVEIGEDVSLFSVGKIIMITAIGLCYWHFIFKKNCDVYLNSGTISFANFINY